MTSKEKLNNTKWSFSTIHTYEDCPYCFYCKKLDDDKIGIPNFYAECGSFAHSILARIFSKEITIDDAIDEWINTYEDVICSDAKQSTKDKKFEEFIDFLSELDLSFLDKYDVLEIELKSEWKLGKYDMIGFIDMLIQNKETKEIILIDHKSLGKFMKKDGTPLKNMLSSFEAYKKQMYLYCIPIKEKYGKYPIRIIWNHFFSKEVTEIPFKEEELVETKEWAKKTIGKILKDKTFEAYCFNDEKHKDNFIKCTALCEFRTECEYL